VEGQNEDIRHLEEKISNLKSEVISLKLTKEVKHQARSKLFEAIELKTVKCESLKEANDRLQADIQAKQVINSICEKNYSKIIKKLNDKLNLSAHSEGNVARVKDLKQKYDELCTKYKEVQRKLSERDGNVN
ncbi:hypothetical protein GIB67_027594, partial [Kingdonia uniflora]